MADDMGTFRIAVAVENSAHRGERRVVGAALVDTGSELSWFPAEVLESLGIERVKLVRVRQASGAVVERWTGGAVVHAGGTMTFDEVVFGEPGDMVLLGARSLEGLNLMVDSSRKSLVDAGPTLACAAA